MVTLLTPITLVTLFTLVTLLTPITLVTLVTLSHRTSFELVSFANMNPVRNGFL